jgi:prepilin-type N-terminal cleavage/methylation domain-containing protein/prepilin-type processing-associated H-X9-DG protein
MPNRTRRAFTLVELPAVSERKRGAFTLVELLVVIGIIALLISILLPTLGRARKAANNVKCSANLRSIVQGMQIYAAQYNGYIPGSAHTTARFIYVNPAASPTLQLNPAFGDGNCPSVCGIFDWMSPIARVMAIRFDEGGSTASRKSRFEQLVNHPAFKCPENEFRAVPFSGSPIAYTGPMVSYNTAMGFMLTRNNTGTNNTSGATGPTGRTIGRIDQNPPSGYNVKVTKVGNPARKIYIADGARFSNTAVPPDVDLTYTGGNGGAFSDQGAGARFSQSWDRGLAQGNNNRAGGGTDARIYAYRHGQIAIRGRGDIFKFNAGFFDGHVETLGDLQGAEPSLWFPKGTQLVVDTNQMYQDVITRHYKGQTYPSSGYFMVP